MEKGKVVYFSIFLALFLLVSTTFISAGFWNKLTGMATNAPTNVSATIRGTNPVVIKYVSPISSTILNESGYTLVTFYTTLRDQDGNNDINKTSVNASFSRLGEAIRSTGNNGTCSFTNNVIGTGNKESNYTCIIKMWYFDGAGDWNITVQGRDNGNLSLQYNASTWFTVQTLYALVLSSANLSWGTLDTGALNQTAVNHPTIVNNTGNYNGTINLKAFDLLGETNSLELINSSNFSAGIGNLSSCVGTALQNNTVKTIVGTSANKGNLSAGAGAGQASLYYCMPQVPEVSSQTYSTAAGGSWIVSYN